MNRPRTASNTEILPPLHLDRLADRDWDQSCDVLVIGWGAAGACAALEARSQGAEVIVADRFTGGGASAKSGGVVYAGAVPDSSRTPASATPRKRCLTTSSTKPVA